MICIQCGEILECRACTCEQGAISRGAAALALVAHLSETSAAACLLPVVDRAEEYVVIVMSKDAYERREWPVGTCKATRTMTCMICGETKPVNDFATTDDCGACVAAR